MPPGADRGGHHCPGASGPVTLINGNVIPAGGCRFNITPNWCRTHENYCATHDWIYTKRDECSGCVRTKADKATKDQKRKKDDDDDDDDTSKSKKKTGKGGRRSAGKQEKPNLAKPGKNIKSTLKTIRKKTPKNTDRRELQYALTKLMASFEEVVCLVMDS